MDTSTTATKPALQGQTKNLALATLAFAISFWAWNMIAPLGVQITRLSPGHRLLGRLGIGRSGLRGIHGHRSELPEMAGLFAAVGRGVAAGARPGTVRAVDVAPTVLALLALPIPEWMEGRPIPLEAGGASR